MKWDKKVDPFYKSPAWRRARQQALERDMYLCQDCLAAKQRGERVRVRGAEVVHHIQPRELRPDLALELSNLISLCDACHNKRHPEKGGHGAEKKPTSVGGVRIVKV